jgi:thioredoxin reductase (NADPH)
MGLNIITLEQDTLGGTVFNFPRAKIVMTSPMDLPGHGKVKLFQTSKTELLELWQGVIKRNNIKIIENSKVEQISKKDGNFLITTLKGDSYMAHRVLLAIGRRGTPRKLGVAGENLEKVAYKLLEPELIHGKNIIVVGGGDSAIENALLLADDNNVVLSYRSETFSRLKPLNAQKIQQASDEGRVKVMFETQIKEIGETHVCLSLKNGDEIQLENDLVYIFAGGELPTQFLQKAGIEISKRFNYTMLSHKN